MSFARSYKKRKISQRRAYKVLKRYTRRAEAVGEIKGVDYDLDDEMPLNKVVPATFNTNDAIICVNAIRQGTGSYERVGRKIKPRTLFIRGVIRQTSTANGTMAWPAQVRMCVVWDKQPSGVLPTYDQIFGITDSEGDTQVDFSSPPNYANMDRFRVLADEIVSGNTAFGAYIVGNPAPAFNGATQHVFERFVRIPKTYETVYGATAEDPSVAQISSGALYVIFRATQAADTLSTIDFGVARLRYTD